METIDLKDYTVPRTPVPLPGKKQIMVRGLCADDLTFLITTHLSPIIRAVERYQAARKDILVRGSLNEFILTIAQDFPEIVAEVISAATDQLNDETRSIARKLPFGVQMSALYEIIKLTEQEAGGLKNLLAEMQARLGLAGVGVEAQTAPLKTN